MFRRVVLAFGFLVASAFVSTPSGDAATLANAWMARYGSLGTITVRQFTSLNGTLVVNVSSLRPAALYGVTLYRGSCTGTVISKVTLSANAYGKISRTLSLTAAQERSMAAAPAVKFGSTCRILAQTFPVTDTGLRQGTALTLLASLPTAAETSTGYDRALFVHWIDADGDGCDTRDEVLLAEATTAPSVGSGCTIHGGTWYSAYDGVTTNDASTFDIDHLVPLAEAWASGASAWTPARRQDYANDLGDPRTLLAVSASANRSKSDGDPADWLPPLESFRCTYADDWVAVKTRWGLSVDDAERAALVGLLDACPADVVSVTIATPAATAPTPTPTPGPTHTPTPTATPAPATGCDPNYAGFCVPIVSYDLDCSDIQHRVIVVGVDRHRFDGDGDGIGCESYS